MFDRVPFFSRPRRGHRRARALQGVFLAVFAPVGWLALQALQGVSPADVARAHPGLMAYMLLGTMAAFGVFGWLLGREEERLSRLAMLDELTGLANNRLFGARLEECLVASRRSGRPLSLLLVDMDRFKDINDSHGHQAGDLALKTAASVIRSSIRASDVAARIGGEEFAVILPETGTKEAADVAGRVLSGLRGADVRLGDGTMVNLSASIGLSGGIPASGESGFALFAQADKALYKAKETGRGRLVTA
ncbi:GGDEF domain-containing protein [Fundidesulfovibrio terrae]|uniref:GGDEF domain-containing protein n=1 Tax=Fundidesulfovibrio terrae TaxID=2922866 RepID=UPI001FAE7F1D|nr:GGDEF domain-containing protein [Fundidesulfovibrio terrae]